jgi:hypothetical protein
MERKEEEGYETHIVLVLLVRRVSERSDMPGLEFATELCRVIHGVTRSKEYRSNSQLARIFEVGTRAPM